MLHFVRKIPSLWHVPHATCNKYQMRHLYLASSGLDDEQEGDFADEDF